MKNLIICILIVACFPNFLRAQTENIEKTVYPVNEATLIGIGGSNIRNTYFSNSRTKYDGVGLRLLNERMRITSLANNRISSQQLLNLEFSFTENAANTVNVFSGFADYSYGLHYRFQPMDNFRILTGASARGMFGFMYNTQAANNTTTFHLDIDLNISAAAIYSFNINRFPLIIRYQMDIPIMGALFSPKYGQSYYEIFGLENTSGVMSFSSFHNKFAIRNYLTADFPLGNLIVRAGYLGSAYYTNVNYIKVHNVSHSLIVGVVKEFVPARGKRLKNKQVNNSAFY